MDKSGCTLFSLTLGGSSRPFLPFVDTWKCSIADSARVQICGALGRQIAGGE